MSASLASRALLAALRLARVKHWATPGALHRLIRISRAMGPARPSQGLRKRCRVIRRNAHGDIVYDLAPQQGAARCHVLYLAGGAFAVEISFLHWRLIGELTSRARCTVTVPLYPLAPERNCLEILASAVAHYRDLAAQVGAENIVLIGDSAGGGLCLTLAQALLAQNLPQPRRIILLSPWLDLAMSEPGTVDLDAADPLLTIPTALAAARSYAGVLALDDPRVSPLHGAISGLAPVTIFTGTRDLLNAGARSLTTRLRQAGQSVELLDYPGMIHAWMLFSVPEARQARNEIVARLGSV